MGGENGMRLVINGKEIDIVNKFIERITAENRRSQLDGFEKVLMKMKDFSPVKEDQEAAPQLTIEDEREIVESFERQLRAGRRSSVSKFAKVSKISHLNRKRSVNKVSFPKVKPGQSILKQWGGVGGSEEFLRGGEVGGGGGDAREGGVRGKHAFRQLANGKMSPSRNIVRNGMLITEVSRSSPQHGAVKLVGSTKESWDKTGEEKGKIARLRMEADLRLATLRQEKIALDMVRGTHHGATEDEADLRGWADWLRGEVDALFDDPQTQTGEDMEDFSVKVPLEASQRKYDAALGTLGKVPGIENLVKSDPAMCLTVNVSPTDKNFENNATRKSLNLDVVADSHCREPEEHEEKIEINDAVGVDVKFLDNMLEDAELEVLGQCHNIEKTEVPEGSSGKTEIISPTAKERETRLNIENIFALEKTVQQDNAFIEEQKNLLSKREMLETIGSGKEDIFTEDLDKEDLVKEDIDKEDLDREDTDKEDTEVSSKRAVNYGNNFLPIEKLSSLFKEIKSNSRLSKKRKRKQEPDDQVNKSRKRKKKEETANNPNFIENKSNDNPKAAKVVDNSCKLTNRSKKDKILKAANEKKIKMPENTKKKEEVKKSKKTESVGKQSKGSQMDSKRAEDLGRKKSKTKGKKKKEQNLETNEIFSPAEEVKKPEETKKTDLIALDDVDEEEEVDEEMNEIIEEYMAEHKRGEEVEVIDVDDVLVIDEVIQDEQVDGSVAEEEGRIELSGSSAAAEGLPRRKRVSKSKARGGSLKRPEKEGKKTKTKVLDVERAQEKSEAMMQLKIKRRKEKEEKKLEKEAQKLEKRERKKKSLSSTKIVENKKSKYERTIKHRMETVRWKKNFHHKYHRPSPFHFYIKLAYS